MDVDGVGALAALVLADGRFPAGSYAHSGGLEAAVAAGLEAGLVPDYVAGRLVTVGRVEASLALAARRAALEASLEGLLGLDLEAQARSAAEPQRRASGRLGSALLRTAATVWPGDALVGSYRDASAATPRPVAYGVVCAAAGLSDRDTARTWLYEDAAAVTSAAVRLLPVDAGTATRWLVELLPAIDRLTAATLEGSPPVGELPAAGAAMLEIYALRHARAEGRLFAT